MDIAALVLLVITALFGAFLLSYVFKTKNTPKGVAIVHGTLGALGIIFLAFKAPTYPWLVVLFCAVALGGLALITLDLSGKKIPKAMALGHGILGIVGVLSLLYFLI